MFQTAFYGWASECVVDAIKVRTFASVLRRDAKYFDQNETSNAKIIAKINSDAPQLKSVCFYSCNINNSHLSGFG